MVLTALFAAAFAAPHVEDVEDVEIKEAQMPFFPPFMGGMGGMGGTYPPMMNNMNSPSEFNNQQYPIDYSENANSFVELVIKSSKLFQANRAPAAATAE